MITLTCIGKQIPSICLKLKTKLLFNSIFDFKLKEYATLLDPTKISVKEIKDEANLEILFGFHFVSV